MQRAWGKKKKVHILNKPTEDQVNIVIKLKKKRGEWTDTAENWFTKKKVRWGIIFINTYEHRPKDGTD